MRGLCSLLAHSLSQVSKSGSLFLPIGSGFTEKS